MIPVETNRILVCYPKYRKAYLTGLTAEDGHIQLRSIVKYVKRRVKTDKKMNILTIDSSDSVLTSLA